MRIVTGMYFMRVRLMFFFVCFVILILVWGYSRRGG